MKTRTSIEKVVACFIFIMILHILHFLFEISLEDWLCIITVAMVGLFLAILVDLVVSVRKAFKDKFIRTAVNEMLHFVNDWDNDKWKKFIQNYQSNCNTCFGLLFDGECDSKIYLAFSNNKAESDKIGQDFDNGTNHIYCQYSADKLNEILPVYTLDTDLEPIKSDKLDKLNDYQKKHQTCAERKIMARVLNDCGLLHTGKRCKKASNDLSLVLFTKLAPCEFCRQLIMEYKDSINIKVLYIDFMKLMIENVGDLSDLSEKHQATLIAALHDIKELLAKMETGSKNTIKENTENQNTSEEETAVNTSKKSNREQQLLYTFAKKLCDNLRIKSEESYSIKTVLESLETKDGHHLSEAKINELVENVNSSEEKKT